MKKLALFSLTIMFLSVSAWYGIKWVDTNDDFAIKNIILMTQVSKQNKQDLINITRQSIDGNFFSLNINKLRTSIEELPWIEQVSIRKVWSDSIQIRIIEKKVRSRWVRIAKLNKKQPATSWDQHTLLSDKGDIFKPELSVKQQQQFSQFSLYSGPEKLAKTIMEKCRKMSDMLTRIKFKIASCVLDQRRSWALSIMPGATDLTDSNKQIKLILGRSETNELEHLINNNSNQNELIEHKIVKKIDLFIQLYQQALYKHKNNIQKIDMRYTNGFAVSWKEKNDIKANS